MPCANVSFNILQQALHVWPFGQRFIDDVHTRKRAIFAWTVNKDEMMRWCIAHQLDGVITDDPKRFREVQDEWRAGKRDVALDRATLRMLLWIMFCTVAFRVILAWRTREGWGRKRNKGVGRIKITA